MRNRKKKGHKLYAFTVLTLGIAIIVLSIIVFFYVQKIEITGNEYTKDAEIVAVIQEDPAAVNSLYVLGKYKLNKYEMPGSLESAKISLSAPWALKVTVKERPIVGFIYDDDGYVYFDKDGLVVCKGREVIEGVPQLEGIEVKKAKLYKPVNCGEKELFESALKLMNEVKLCELTPDRIVCENGELYLYFAEVCVAIGNTVSTEKIAQIKPIVAELEGQIGTLHLEFYENESSTVTFIQGELPGQEAAVEEEAKEDETADEVAEESYDESYEEEYYEESYDESYEEEYYEEEYYDESYEEY